jgi:hypothetical protein
MMPEMCYDDQYSWSPSEEAFVSQQSRLNVQAIGASLDDICEVLGIAGSVDAGTEVMLPEGTALKVEDVSKSSGFEATTVILTAVISVATSASKEILMEWLKSRLFKSGPKPPTVAILIDGKEIQVRSGS